MAALLATSVAPGTFFAIIGVAAVAGTLSAVAADLGVVLPVALGLRALGRSPADAAEAAAA